MNKDVPIETVAKQLIKENKKLHQRISELEDQLSMKNKAISEFKKWQSKVATYKYQYWLNEGINLMDTAPDPHQVKNLKAAFSNHASYSKLVKRLDNLYRGLKSNTNMLCNTQ